MGRFQPFNGWQTGTALWALTVVTAASGPAWAAPLSTPPPTDPATLQARATVLAAAIRQQGLELDRLAERVDEARLHASQVAADLAVTEAKVAATNTELRKTLGLIRMQALDTYVGVDARQVPMLEGAGGANALVLRQAYADAVSATQGNALRRLHSLRQQLADAESHLADDQSVAQAALAQVTADQQAAARQAAAEHVTLSQVQGQLADLVRTEQARLAAAEAARVQAGLGLAPVALPAPGPVASRAPPPVTVAPTAPSPARPPQDRRL
jgi:hypothetical protein